MRDLADATKIRTFVAALGRQCHGSGCVYLVGGATAVLYGWRATTVDIDIKLDPEPAGAFGAIRQLKEQLDVNVELSSPDAFVPAAPGWRERSPLVSQVGEVTFRHFDLYTQAFAKIERAHERDKSDVRAMITMGLVDSAKLIDLVREALVQIERYPHLDLSNIKAKITQFFEELGGRDGAK